MLLLFFFLHLNPTKHEKTFRQHVGEFDFVGLFLIISGIICLLVGFSESQFGCKMPKIVFTKDDLNFKQGRNRPPSRSWLSAVSS